MRDDSLLDIELSSYYSAAQGLYGDELLNALRLILNTGVSLQTYGDSRYILDETDRDPNNPNNVLLLYNGASVSGVWDGGITWNREHVWPQSLLGSDAVNEVANIASDLHNLKPANPSINSSRGNKYFADLTTSVSYGPRVEDRGDIARILFYMIVMYDYLELVNTEPSVYKMALLDLMFDWHEADQVNTFETYRNNVIYSYQNNRNPFIDYPHLLELIFFTNSHYLS
jgi:endonuclease I